MAGSNGSNGHVNAPLKAVLSLPTIEELRRAYEEGLPQMLLSGLEVYMRPVQPDKLLMSGKVPDILTPLVMGMMFAKEKAADETVFPDEVDNPVDAYLNRQRQEAKDAIEFIKSVDVVCEAALVQPDIVPYLSLQDRLWIFRLAWMPVEVLRNFRLQPARTMEAGDSSGTEPQQTEPDVAVDSATV
jgi:hypothetical protein